MESTKNKVGAILLVLFILFIAIGGYFFMSYMVNTSNEEKSDEENNTDFRIDTTKDYVYIEGGEEVIEDAYINQDVVINIKGFESINTTLKSERESILSNVVKVDDAPKKLPEDTTCENDIYSFSYREYDVIEYSKYVSLVIVDYDYYCEYGSRPNNIKSYVIDKETGKSISNDELFKTFEVNETDINNLVKKRLDETQTLTDDREVNNVENTINSLINGSYGKNKALSVGKNGKLMFNFIVMSNKINYNDSIELN